MYRYLALPFSTVKFLVVLIFTIQFFTTGFSIRLGEDDSVGDRELPSKCHPVSLIKGRPNMLQDNLAYFIRMKNYSKVPRFVGCETTLQRHIINNTVPLQVLLAKKRKMPVGMQFGGERRRLKSQRRPPSLNLLGFQVQSSLGSLEVILSANDFLRLLHNRLLRKANSCFVGLAKDSCSDQFLIKVHYHSGDGTAICQWVYDPDCTLMKGDIFDPGDHNHLLEGKKGTTRVGFYSIDGQKALCIKSKPQYPFLERALRLMNEALYGEDDDCSPNSETILMNGHTFTVSRYVEGRDFEAVMQDKALETACETDFIENLHRIKVLVMLTSPGDGRAQNYFWG